MVRALPDCLEEGLSCHLPLLALGISIKSSCSGTEGTGCTVVPWPLGTTLHLGDTFHCACHTTQMTKKIKKLEKETTMYRSRWESSNKALLEMAEEVSSLQLGFHACLCKAKALPALPLEVGSQVIGLQGKPRTNGRKEEGSRKNKRCQ